MTLSELHVLDPSVCVTRGFTALGTPTNQQNEGIQCTVWFLHCGIGHSAAIRLYLVQPPSCMGSDGAGGTSC